MCWYLLLIYLTKVSWLETDKIDALINEHVTNIRLNSQLTSRVAHLPEFSKELHKKHQGLIAYFVERERHGIHMKRPCSIDRLSREVKQPTATTVHHCRAQSSWLSLVPLSATIVKSGNFRDVIMSTIASQITSLTIVYSTVDSVVDQRKHQSSASLSFVRGIHRGPVNSPHKWPVTRKIFPLDDVIMRRKDSGSGTSLPTWCDMSGSVS